MASNSETTERVVSAEENILGAISLGLHQTTQPLTILQGTLELALLNANTLSDCRDAIERSLEEVQRVTGCLEHLRTITQLRHKVSDVSTFAIVPMVRTVLASLKGRSVATGVEFAHHPKGADGKDPHWQRVRLSPSRLSSALKMALSELALLTEPGSKVVVLIEEGTGDVLIRANVDRPLQQGISIEGVSSLTPGQKLAGELIASAGGTLTCNSQGILFRLPKALSAKLGSEIESGDGEVANV